jgi:four helix bundle protein
MLRIYDVMLRAIVLMAPLIRAIKRHNPRLARQLEDAASSAALNIAEGSGNRGGTRRARYDTALGSAKESVSCLQVAQGWGYISGIPAELTACMNQVIGTLVNVTK